MSAKKRKARKTNAKRRTAKRAKNPGKHHRRRKNPRHTRRKHNARRRHRNPSGTGLLRAFAGGVAGHFVGAVATEGGEMLFGHEKPGTKKPNHLKTLVRVGGKFVPAIIAYAMNDDGKPPSPFLFGMMGASGAGVGHETVVGLLKMRGPGTPPSWAKWLGAGGGHSITLPDGSVLYHDESKGPMMMPALAPGQMGPPAPIALPAGASGLTQITGIDFMTSDGKKMQAMGVLPSGDILYREHGTNEFNTIDHRDMNMEDLKGLVAVGDLVHLTGGIDEGEDAELEEEEQEETEGFGDD